MELCSDCFKHNLSLQATPLLYFLLAQLILNFSWKHPRGLFPGDANQRHFLDGLSSPLVIFVLCRQVELERRLSRAAAEAEETEELAATAMATIAGEARRQLKSFRQ